MRAALRPSTRGALRPLALRNVEARSRARGPSPLCVLRITPFGGRPNGVSRRQQTPGGWSASKGVAAMTRRHARQSCQPSFPSTRTAQTLPPGPFAFLQGAVRSAYDRWQQVDPRPRASLASSAQEARPTSQPERPAADGCEWAREGQVDGGAGRAADREDRSRRPEARRR